MESVYSVYLILCISFCACYVDKVLEAFAQSVFSYSSACQGIADNVFDTLGFDMV